MLSKAIDISHFKMERNDQSIYNKYPGIYDITNEEYHSSNGISRSGIMEFSKTPFHYYSQYINPKGVEKRVTKSLKIGSALHPFVLENSEFMNRYIVIEKRDKRTKDGKQYYDLMEANKGTKELINEEDFQQIKTMYDSLHSNEKIHELITGGKYEKSLYWNDPNTGLLCKCRPDIWQDGFIVDLKTSSNAGYREFQRSMIIYGYHIQCAMIHEAFKNLFNLLITDFVFIVIENTEPYAHAIYQLGSLSIEKSVEIFKNKLFEMKKCFDKNEWPSYKTQIIDLPTYAIGE